jgi:AcrR family transcriptional regulator
MARKPAPGTRERILDNAARLFQQHGTRAVGTQQIIDECGCGKKLLYGQFATKDDLVVAYLERCQREWTAIMDDATASHVEDPGRQLVALVSAAASQVTAPDFHGCPFRTTHAQFPDDSHPAHQAAVRHIKDLRARLHRVARRTGARDPRALADRLLLIIDGLYTNGSILGRRGAAPVAVALADEVVRNSMKPGHSDALEGSP